jgi:SAM-dependent methyltransferase
MTAQAMDSSTLKFLEEEVLDYQSVQLPGGIVTPGNDRSYLNPLLFGDAFQNKTFLDIGSYLGYFCLEALERGGKTAVGIETSPTNVRIARRIAELRGSKADYVLADFETWDAQGARFDVVACLNVLHHMFDPISALRKMMALARRKIVLEVAVPTWRDVGRDWINPLRVFGVGAPAIFLGIPRKRGDAAGRTYLFTPRSLEILFNTHTSMFEPLRISRSPFKGRILVEAEKRQIGHLIVVAGPTSVGKSSFVKQFQTDPQFRKLLPDSGAMEFVDASDVVDLPRGRHEQLMLHYDFLRPSRTGVRSHDRDPVLHLLRVAERVTILTLVARRDVLREQLQRGEIDRPDRKVRRRDLELLERYGKPQFLADWYEGWMDFCAGYPGATHRLFLNENGFEEISLARWRGIIAE